MFFGSVCVALFQSFELVLELLTQCDASSLRDSALHWRSHVPALSGRSIQRRIISHTLLFLISFGGSGSGEAFNVRSFRTPNNALKVGNVWIDLILECAKRSMSDHFAHRTML